MSNVCSWYIQFLIHLTLICGAYASNSKKAIFDFPSEGLCGERPFRKPWLLCFVMFAGETLCFLPLFITQWWERRQQRQQQLQKVGVKAPLLSNPSDGASHYQSSSSQPSLLSTTFSSPRSRNPSLPLPPIRYYLLFALFDFSATAIGGYGLVYITASANQMLRGSMVVFTALFSIMILHTRLGKLQWMGIWIVVVGEASVGISGATRSWFSPQSDPSAASSILDHTWSEQIWGVFLILLSSAINSLQAVLEEFILKTPSYAPVNPLAMVGWEGFFGSLACLTLLPVLQYLPGNDCGSVENSLDSLAMIRSSPILLVLMFFNTLSLSVINWTLLVISKLLSALYKNFVQALRTVMVWIVSLLLYYVWTSGTQGESFDRYSSIQAIGFVGLIGGTILFGYGKGVEKLEETKKPGRKLSVEEEEIAKEEEEIEKITEAITLVKEV